MAPELLIVALDDLESFGQAVRLHLSQEYSDDCPIDDSHVLSVINRRLSQLFDILGHGPIGLGKNELFASSDEVLMNIEEAPLHDDPEFDLNTLEVALLKLALRHPGVKEHFLRVAMVTVLNMTSDVVLHLTPES